MKTIGGLFGRSPYGPVHEMMLKVQECVERVPGLLAAHAAGDWPEMETSAGHIDRLEGQADDIKAEIRGHLSTSLFSSVERGEILDLVHCLDGIADACQDAGKLMSMRHTRLPSELASGYSELGARLVKAAQSMTAITVKLSGEAGAKPDVTELMAELAAVGRLEFECDEIQHSLCRQLFTMEDRLGPMDIFFMMNIINQLGRIADETENAADGLSRVLGSR